LRPTPLIDAGDEAEYGGKAAHLAAALRWGLPVPSGFALATGYVEAVVAGDPRAIERLHAEFAAQTGPFAVRSSAIGEDSGGASFAGQHLTVLNVRTPEEAAPAVARVHASAHTSSALMYRKRLGLSPQARMAVVFQTMIEPDCAGVMFTRNPMTGADERVIEAAWGLGEAVVAGIVVPDNYVVDRNGHVVRIRPGEKPVALRSAPSGGTIEVEVAEPLVEEPCLGEAELLQLHDLANRCEAQFGAGQDIEWAYAGGTLYLLQCRAITRNR
jgi:pyruvate,water dikinase